MYIMHARCVVCAWHTARTMSTLCMLSKSACYACCSPDRVISSPAACSSLPTNALASLNATESMGPEGGTPMCHSFVRPGQSCRLTCGVLLYNLVMACMSCCDCLCSNAYLDCSAHVLNAMGVMHATFACGALTQPSTADHELPCRVYAGIISCFSSDLTMSCSQKCVLCIPGHSMLTWTVVFMPTSMTSDHFVYGITETFLI